MSFDLFSCVFEHDFSDHLKCLHRFQIISLLESKRTVVQVVRVKYGDSSEIDTESHSTNTFFSSFSHCFWNSACLSLMVWTLEMLRIAYKHKFPTSTHLTQKQRCFLCNVVWFLFFLSLAAAFRTTKFILFLKSQILVRFVRFGRSLVKEMLKCWCKFLYCCCFVFVSSSFTVTLCFCRLRRPRIAMTHVTYFSFVLLLLDTKFIQSFLFVFLVHEKSSQQK